MEKQGMSNRIKEIFRCKTVRKRMMVSFVSVFLIAITLMGIGIYTFTCRLLIEKNQQSYGGILNAAEEVLQDTLNTYIGFARILLDNPSVQNVLTEKDTGDGFYMNPSRSAELSNSWKSYANGIDGVESLYLFDNNGKLYYQDQNKSSRIVMDNLNFVEIKEEQWYQKALELKGKEVFFGRDVLWNDEENISCVKTINQLGSNKKIGMLVINIKHDVLENVVRLSPVDGDMYAITYQDSQGKTIVCENGYDAGGYESSMENILENQNNQYENTIHLCEEKGWELVHVVKKEEIFREAKMVRIIIFCTGLITVLFIVFLCAVQAIQITKPLYQLKENIRSVGQGEREFHNTFVEDDEIGEIGIEFQKMVKEKLELKEKITEEEILRKDSELQLLQSQINPHFLYNTLDTLYWMAIEKDAQDVADLTQSLSEIFKTSLNNGEEFIPIKNEIQFIEDYLYIQNVRFEGKFLTKIQVEEDINEIKIVKQILQPFVENAIYHGLEPQIGQGLVSVEGRQDGDFLLFVIQDNGVGIGEGIDVKNGYAVSNVLQRIKLHYGEKADIIFESKKDCGTRVRILLPLEEVRNAGSRIGG